MPSSVHGYLTGRDDDLVGCGTGLLASAGEGLSTPDAGYSPSGYAYPSLGYSGVGHSGIPTDYLQIPGFPEAHNYSGLPMPHAQASMHHGPPPPPPPLLNSNHHPHSQHLHNHHPQQHFHHHQQQQQLVLSLDEKRDPREPSGVPCLDASQSGFGLNELVGQPASLSEAYPTPVPSIHGYPGSPSSLTLPRASSSGPSTPGSSHLHSAGYQAGMAAAAAAAAGAAMHAALSARLDNMNTGCLGGKQKRGVLPKRATQIMKHWLFQHLVVSSCKYTLFESQT
ncbi:unnamed protein product [Protopolystoma xenopodis]|uniref:MEIS N-terminal domain-containing protein n=1 Tax=Protopolystoma xenopodis TaxID=117903 RepID=A0A3S4ZJ57_9PLAT|nr:unnamed protein product [Protopolystoma xenopodis]